MIIFPDDIVIVAQNENDLQDSLNHMEEAMTAYNPKFNYTKTKVIKCVKTNIGEE